MKTLTININHCLECPFCRYLDNYDGYRAEDMGHDAMEEGFYCTNGKRAKFISEGYDNDKGDINIPDWCEL